MSQVPDPQDILTEVRALTDALLNSQITPESGLRLQTLVCADSQARALYVRYVHQESVVAAQASAIRLDFDEVMGELEAAEPQDLSETMVLPAIRLLPEYPGLSDEMVEPAAQPHHHAQTPSRRFPWRLASAILLPLLLATSGWLLFRPHAPLSILVRSVDADWGSGPKLQPGQELPSDTLDLTAGVVELKFALGAGIIIEGPARFRIGSDNWIELDSGRLAATVPSSAHGFTVRTPTANVVDLGTQFGVDVSSPGRTVLEVFKGQVQFSRSHTGAADETPATLVAGEAASVSNGVLSRSADGAVPQNFVRTLSPPKSIDMVDLLCGGDGTTQLRSGAIDPRTGNSGNLSPVGRVDVADTQYHPVPNRPMIDGCFVPSGNMTVDSAGHVFNFGPTSGQSFDYLQAGGTIAWPNQREHFSAVLGGVDYAAFGHGLILTHPNCGVTFDLAAIRRLHPGGKIAIFKAVTGNCHSTSAEGDPVDVLVLVDGVLRFARRGILASDGSIDVGMPLNEADRFLTITSSSSKVGTRDWMILGDPRLE